MSTTAPDLSVNELLLAFWDHASQYYPSKELACMRDALKPLKTLYGHTLVRQFGPRALKAVRSHMIHEQNLARTVINPRISRIKRVFKWAVADELIPAAVYHGLQAVEGLRRGACEARETAPVQPVPDEHVEALLPFVSPQVAAMIQLQRLTGMRPGEVVLMRPCDIDQREEVWIYEPQRHKGTWRGQCKRIPLGPRAQKHIKPFLDRDPAAYLFSPVEAELWRLEHRQAHYKSNRKTPVYPSELRQLEKAKLQRRGRISKRPKRNRYDTDSYRRAIHYGIRKAAKEGVQIAHWHPSQLRHTRGTEIRRQYGLEGAQVVLGHSRADVTQIYAERDFQAALSIARQSG